MNGTYEFYTIRYSGQVVLCNNTAKEIARFTMNDDGMSLFNVTKQQIKQNGGKLLNLDKGEWVI